MILYHGTNKQFDKFEPTGLSFQDMEIVAGYYFTNDQQTALSYGSNLKQINNNFKVLDFNQGLDLTEKEIAQLISFLPKEKLKEKLEDFEFDVKVTPQKIEEIMKDYYVELFKERAVDGLNALSNHFCTTKDDQHKLNQIFRQITKIDGFVKKTEVEIYALLDCEQVNSLKRKTYKLK